MHINSNSYLHDLPSLYSLKHDQVFLFFFACAGVHKGRARGPLIFPYSVTLVEITAHYHQIFHLLLSSYRCWPVSTGITGSIQTSIIKENPIVSHHTTVAHNRLTVFVYCSVI